METNLNEQMGMQMLTRLASTIISLHTKKLVRNYFLKLVCFGNPF